MVQMRTNGKHVQTITTQRPNPSKTTMVNFEQRIARLRFLTILAAPILVLGTACHQTTVLSAPRYRPTSAVQQERLLISCPSEDAFAEKIACRYQIQQTVHIGKDNKNTIQANWLGHAIESTDLEITKQSSEPGSFAPSSGWFSRSDAGFANWKHRHLVRTYGQSVPISGPGTYNAQARGTIYLNRDRKRTPTAVVSLRHGTRYGWMPLCSVSSSLTCRYSLTYLPSHQVEMYPSATQHPLSIQIEHQDTWRISYTKPLTSKSAFEMDPTSSFGDRTLSESQLDPNISEYQLDMHVPGSDFHPGGPLLGIGLQSTDGLEFRMRFGYEIAWPSWILYSLNLESDFRKRLTVVPLVNFAVNQDQSLLFGIGAPWQFTPTTQAGLRTQISLQLLMVALVAGTDFVPSATKHDEKSFRPFAQLVFGF
jgi:hypothetical protein